MSNLPLSIRFFEASILDPSLLLAGYWQTILHVQPAKFARAKIPSLSGKLVKRIFPKRYWMKSRKFSTQIRTEMIITDLELQKYQTQVRFVLIFLVEYVLASIPRAKKNNKKPYLSCLREYLFGRIKIQNLAFLPMILLLTNYSHIFKGRKQNLKQILCIIPKNQLKFLQSPAACPSR